MRPGAYLVEGYAPRSTGSDVKAAADRASAAAASLTAAGRRVRHLHSVFVPEDETCFHLFEADAPEQVDEVVRCANLDSVRIVKADVLR
jgi:hypothetical protein